MGQCMGTKEQQTNAEVNRNLAKYKREGDDKIKLLLLGAGESGKSTLFKQMKLLYTEAKDFSKKERDNFVKFVHANIVHDTIALVVATKSRKTKMGPKAEAAGQKLLQIKPKAPVEIDRSLGELLANVWNDPVVQEVWEDRGDLQIQDSLDYFMNDIERISTLPYLPTNADILRTRVRTSGVVKDVFVVNGTELEMLDVGGQRNERRKWINAFDDVTCVIFVVAISEYNQVLYEDAQINRQDEAVNLFRDTLAMPYFQSTPFILFLNKEDLFREKLPKIPFSIKGGSHPRNEEFQGPHCDMNKVYSTDGSDEKFEECCLAACNYLQALYEGQSPEERQERIYTKFTTSTDTQNVEHIMDSCKDVIMRGNLSKVGWL